MIPANYTILSGVDAHGVVKCSLVIEMSKPKEVTAMLKHIKAYGYKKHTQQGGTVALGGTLDEATPPPSPKQQSLCFA